MATVAAAIDSAASRPVSGDLWWEPFRALLHDLESALCIDSDAAMILVEDVPQLVRALSNLLHWGSL